MYRRMYGRMQGVEDLHRFRILPKIGVHQR